MNPLSRPLPARWQSAPATAAAGWSHSWPRPALGLALRRGLLARCPACGDSPMFAGFLRVAAVCTVCGAPLGSFRADDAPPYFTILLVGHIIVPVMVFWEQLAPPPLWVEFAVLLPATLALTLLLIRPIKGATLAVMLRLGMMKSADGN